VYQLREDTVPTQLTSTVRSRYPVWSTDGTFVVFQSDRDGDRGLWRQRADGRGTPERLTTAGKSFHFPVALMGDTLLFVESNAGSNSLWMKVGNEPPTLFGGVQSPNTISAALSPDGKWVVYSQQTAGSVSQVHLQPVPPNGEIRPIANGGRVRWPADGNRIYFVRGNEMFAFELTTSPVVRVAVPKPLPKIGRLIGPFENSFDVSVDGRFISATIPGQNENPTDTPSIQVVLNWLDELKRVVPTK
jgi:Tol biopolymer transport system component